MKILNTKITNDKKHYDVIGIGFGPSNLAVAIQLEEVRLLKNKSLFIEQASEFTWHPEMMLDNVTLQNSYLKDLITITNPKSHYSFLNYLHKNRRLEEFINVSQDAPSRQEYSDYLKWAASHFNKIVKYNTQILKIEYPNRKRNTKFEITIVHKDTGKKNILSCNNLVLGIGAEPHIPYKNLLSNTNVIHSSNLLTALKGLNPNYKNGVFDFLIIGGGQSSAEILYHLLLNFPKAKIAVISRSFLYKSLQENPFINYFFSDQGMEEFSSYNPKTREHILFDLKEGNWSAADSSLIHKIYNFLYNEKRNGINRVQLLSYYKIDEINFKSNQFNVFLNQIKDNKKNLDISSQYIIFATGYKYSNVFKYLYFLSDVIKMDKRYNIPMRNKDFSLKTSKKLKSRIYVHSIGDSLYGLTEGGSSNVALRAKRIVRSLADIYSKKI